MFISANQIRNYKQLIFKLGNLNNKFVTKTPNLFHKSAASYCGLLTGRKTQTPLPIEWNKYIPTKNMESNNSIHSGTQNSCAHTGNSASSVDYTDLLSHTYTLATSNDVVGDYIEQICVINGELWCSADTGIHIYDDNGVKLREIKHSQINKTYALTQAHTGDVIVACHGGYGLHELGTDGGYHGMIHAGSYSDVTWYNQYLYALDCDKSQVVVLGRVSEACWKEQEVFKLSYKNGHMDDKICCNNTGIHVTSWNNKRLYHYSHDGQLLSEAGQEGEGNPGKLSYPLLCGVDHHGNTLVADCTNHQIHLHQHNGEWRYVTSLTGDLSCPIYIMMTHEHVYVSTGYHNRKLTKYTKSLKA